jgi:hypothetical protein
MPLHWTPSLGRCPSVRDADHRGPTIPVLVYLPSTYDVDDPRCTTEAIEDAARRVAGAMDREAQRRR